MEPPLPKFLLPAAFAATLAAVAPAPAQFTGPSQAGREMTVAAAAEARPGTYVTLTGRIAAHLREDYYRFVDDSGEIRVEIAGHLWAGRRVAPEDQVRIFGEVDRSAGGTRYVWVERLDLAE